MKIQLAYKFTGENREEVISHLKKVAAVLEKSKHKVYCPILDTNQPKDKRELYLDAISKINNCEAILVLINSSEKSEGMLMEVGHALGLGKKLILAIKPEINTHLRFLADVVIEFNDFNDLINKLENLI